MTEAGEQPPDSTRESSRETLLNICRKGITLYIELLDEHYQSLGRAPGDFHAHGYLENIDQLASDILGRTQLRLGAPEYGGSKLQLVQLADDYDDPKSYAFQFVPNAHTITPEMRAWEVHVAEKFREHELPYADYPF